LSRQKNPPVVLVGFYDGGARRLLRRKLRLDSGSVVLRAAGIQELLRKEGMASLGMRKLAIFMEYRTKIMEAENWLMMSLQKVEKLSVPLLPEQSFSEQNPF
jgi:hypothetical protein